MAAAPALVWFTRDLRLADNAALHGAVRSGRPVVACYVLDDVPDGAPDGGAGEAWAMGGASRWWLHHSLVSLRAGLEKAGLTLVLRRGDSAAVVAGLVEETGAAEVHVSQPNEPAGRAAVDALGGALAGRCTVHRHWTTLLFDPDSIRTKTGGIYGVFTPFSKACFAADVGDALLPAPARIEAAPAPGSDTLEEWGLRPGAPDWAGGLREAWSPGEAGAHDRLCRFTEAAIAGYATARNIPGIEGVSRLSPHLHWGEISVRAVWLAAAKHTGKGPQSYLSELLWREFSAHLLWHHPALPDAPLREGFARMQWRRDPAGLRAWQRGLTGIPIVDAGMRQLWRMGWQHNRVRLITASFLIKHLLIDWREGEAWFWDCLVDADLGSNSQNWQWVAGCGADASPFFRIFNPWLQGKKFDPDGAYVKRWVPELAGLAAEHIHSPWDAPAEVLQSAGVRLGETYPRPVVDLMAGRDRALAAFKGVSDQLRTREAG